MKLYLAGAECENPELLKKLNDCNLLFSYFYKPTLNTLSIPHDVLNTLSFVDSGAFSAWTKGMVVDVDRYINWLNCYNKFIDLFGQLDVIPGTKDEPSSWKDIKNSAEKTWQNYLYMRDKVISPEKLLYTFHVGEPKDFLIQALEWKDVNGEHIPYIALGGMVGKPSVVRRNFLNMCFNIIKKSSNPNVKIHAFGMTERKLLEDFPITSADSTSWVMTGATGAILTDIGVVYVTDVRKSEQNHYLRIFNNSINVFYDMLDEFGFTIDDLVDSRDNRIVYNGLWMSNRYSKIKYNNTKIKRALF